MSTFQLNFLTPKTLTHPKPESPKTRFAYPPGSWRQIIMEVCYYFRINHFVHIDLFVANCIQIAWIWLKPSFSGQAATVFGATGHIGHTLVNNLGRIGSSVTIPHRFFIFVNFKESVFHVLFFRNSTEAYRVQDLRIMGDLGAFNFVQHFDMEQWSEKEIKELISHSNVVYNVIGSWRGKDRGTFIKKIPILNSRSMRKGHLHLKGQ